MIPRKQLDLGWLDLAAALGKSFLPLDRRRLEREIGAAWRDVEPSPRTIEPHGEDGWPAPLTALSVRSGFDAILTVLGWPAQSEVLVSAITIRDMPRILREHGLRPVPVDLDMSTLSVSVADLTRAVTPRTRGILVAHLFGAQMPMEPVIAFARERGLFVWEDCAQAFAGREFRGHPESDVSLFSFGPIKTATALGGAVLAFRDRALQDRVAHVQSTWPSQSRFEFLRRVCRCACLKLLSSRAAFSIFAQCCRWLGTTHDAVVSCSVRGFAGADFFRRIRRQPSLPLLALLLRRLRQHHEPRIARRIDLARRINSALAGVDRPGHAAHQHSFWVDPIHHARPDELVQHLWRNGFDATRGASSMALVELDDPALRCPPQASQSLERLLYLPFSDCMTDADIHRLAITIEKFEPP